MLEHSDLKLVLNVRILGSKAGFKTGFNVRILGFKTESE